jgi:glycosyltransferase involved in cell wall biosynthesis
MAAEQPEFSVVIATYERPQRLARCLEALAWLDDPAGGFEVIVVDDGGAMPLDDVVSPHRDRLALRLLVQAHAGPATARNYGAAHARGRILVFTDDDCEPEPEWLRALQARFAGDRAAAVGGRTLNALPENVYSTASQLLIDYLYAYFNRERERATFLASNNLAIPAAEFLAIGGFDTGFPRAAGEDRELCDRWLHLGHRLVYAPEVVIRHAHFLTLGGFVRQHFHYGRGAFHFHRVRQERVGGGIEVEPARFYSALLRYPTGRARGLRRVTLPLLFVLSQAANAAGFFWERGTRPRREGDRAPQGESGKQCGGS